MQVTGKSKRFEPSVSSHNCWKLCLRVALPAVAIFGFLLIAYFGYHLLMSDKLDGAEYVSLMVAFAVISLVVAFASEVQEFSVGGNIVKLREVKRKADDSIHKLEAARTATFRFLLSLVKRYPGGYTSISPVDARIEEFWYLHSQIVKFSCEKELSSELLEVVNELLKGQLTSIGNVSPAVNKKYGSKGLIPDPFQLADVLGETLTDSDVTCGSSTIKSKLDVGLSEYIGLYDLRQFLLQSRSA